jgi:hypothetical protein
MAQYTVLPMDGCVEHRKEYQAGVPIEFRKTKTPILKFDAVLSPFTYCPIQ